MAECPICYDSAPLAPLCATVAHSFCAECRWRCCESSLGEGLVPACPLDRRCGAVSREVVVAALDDGAQLMPSSRRKLVIGKLDDLYRSVERAKAGAVQCIGKGCEEWYVPAMPHSE